MWRGRQALHLQKRPGWNESESSEGTKPLLQIERARLAKKKKKKKKQQQKLIPKIKWGERESICTYIYLSIYLSIHPTNHQPRDPHLSASLPQ